MTKAEASPQPHQGATADRAAIVVSPGERTRTYQNKNVQHVRATAGFWVGMPTCDITRMPARALTMDTALRLSASDVRRRAAHTTIATAHAIHARLPTRPSSAR